MKKARRGGEAVVACSCVSWDLPLNALSSLIRGVINA